MSKKVIVGTQEREEGAGSLDFESSSRDGEKQMDLKII